MKNAIKANRAHLVFITVISFLFVCPAMKGFSDQESQSQVKTSTIRLITYRTTTTINASIEEFSEYFAKLGSTELGVSVDMDKHYERAGEPKPLGNKVYSPMRKGPIKLKGDTILVKADADNFWLVWDGSRSYHTRRWHFEPVDEGMMITVTMAISADFTNISSLDSIWYSQVLKGFGDLDNVLTLIQAHFDPSIDPLSQQALGLRGEIFEGLTQVHEVGIASTLKPAEVIKRLESPSTDYLGFGVTGDQCPYGSLSDGQVLYCRLATGLGGSGDYTDTFTLVRKNVSSVTRRTYYITGDNSGKIELSVSRKGLGSKATLVWTVELPATDAEGAFEQTLFIATISQKAQDAIDGISDNLQD